MRLALLLALGCGAAPVRETPRALEPCAYLIECGTVPSDSAEACATCLECLLAMNPFLRAYEVPELSCEDAEAQIKARTPSFLVCSRMGTRENVMRLTSCGDVLQVQ